MSSFSSTLLLLLSLICFIQSSSATSDYDYLDADNYDENYEEDYDSISNTNYDYIIIDDKNMVAEDIRDTDDDYDFDGANSYFSEYTNSIENEITTRGKKDSKKENSYDDYDDYLRSQNNNGKGGRSKKKKTDHPTRRPTSPISITLSPTISPSNPPSSSNALRTNLDSSFPCANEKIFQSMLYLNVTGDPDKVLDETEFLEQAVNLAYEGSLNSLCAFRTLENVKLIEIIEDDGQSINVTTSTAVRYLIDESDEDNDDRDPSLIDDDDGLLCLGSNFTLHFDAQIRCYGCPDDAKGLNDAFRRRRTTRTLQRVEGACYCDSELIEDGFVDNIGPNIAPTKQEFLNEFNRIIEEEDKITSIKEAYDVEEETELIGPQICLAVSLLCDTASFNDSDDDNGEDSGGDGGSCNSIDAVRPDELQCDLGQSALRLGWIYRGLPCSATNTNQQSFSCEDFDVLYPISEGVYVEVFAIEAESSLFEDYVFPGDNILMNFGRFELTVETVKVTVRTNDNEGGSLIQSISFNITCVPIEDLTIGKMFGSLQLASYTSFNSMRVEGFQKLYFTYLVQNVSPSRKDITSLAIDFNGESDVVSSNSEDSEAALLESSDITTNIIERRISIIEPSSIFVTFSAVATGDDGQVCREDNKALVLVRRNVVPTPLPSSSPVSQTTLDPVSSAPVVSTVFQTRSLGPATISPLSPIAINEYESEEFVSRPRYGGGKI